jgi:hypothetical protein
MSATLMETGFTAVIPENALRSRDVGSSADSVAAASAIAEPTRAFDEERFADYRKRAIAFAARPRREETIDATLADSFPASDPPPWTLGVSGGETASPVDVRVRATSTLRMRSRPWQLHWTQPLIALGGAGLIALAFGAAILLVGSVVALVIRLALAAVPGMR